MIFRNWCDNEQLPRTHQWKKLGHDFGQFPEIWLRIHIFVLLLVHSSFFLVQLRSFLMNNEDLQDINELSLFLFEFELLYWRRRFFLRQRKRLTFVFYPLILNGLKIDFSKYEKYLKPVVKTVNIMFFIVWQNESTIGHTILLYLREWS